MSAHSTFSQTPAYAATRVGGAKELAAEEALVLDGEFPLYLACSPPRCDCQPDGGPLHGK